MPEGPDACSQRQQRARATSGGLHDVIAAHPRGRRCQWLGRTIEHDARAVPRYGRPVSVRGPLPAPGVREHTKQVHAGGDTQHTWAATLSWNSALVKSILEYRRLTRQGDEIKVVHHVPIEAASFKIIRPGSHQQFLPVCAESAKCGAAIGSLH